MITHIIKTTTNHNKTLVRQRRQSEQVAEIYTERWQRGKSKREHGNVTESALHLENCSSRNTQAE